MKLYLEVFLYFLKLGATGFGGPISIVAIMQKELVLEKKWIEPERFLKILPLLKAMPGAFAFQTAVYLAVKKAGRWGGILAGIGLVAPAFILMLLLGQFLDAYGEVAWIRPTIEGFQWGALALMAMALKNLTQGYHQNKTFWFLVVLAAASQWFHLISEIFLILILGLVTLSINLASIRKKLFAIVAIPTAGVAVIAVAPSLLSLFWICFSSGAFVFGTGLAITPLLENEFVLKTAWITHDEFMTALALGQMTPGPVLITVTLIGYKILGMAGAFLGTFAVFLPGWIHMLTWFPKASEKLIEIKSIQNFLIGALAAVVGAILVSLIGLAQAGHNPILGLCLIATLIFISIRWKVTSWQLILISGVVFNLAAQILS